MGMSNPYRHSDGEASDLSPDIKTSAGRRLWDMACQASEFIPESEYRRLLERRNLCRDGFNPSEAAVAAERLVAELRGTGSRVVALGRGVGTAFGFRYGADWYSTTDGDGFTATLVPHPSGLCREYNESRYRLETGRVVASMVEAARQQERLNVQQ